MADEKKKEEGWNLTATETLLVGLFILAALSYILPRAFSYIASGELTFFGLRLSGIIDLLKPLVPLFKIWGFGLAGAAALATFVWNKWADAIGEAEKAKIYPENMLIPSLTEPPKNPMAERWEKIVKNSESQNPSDWRMAVIEADIILGDLLNNMRLPGETIGDKLKVVEQSDFNTIEAAWEAHKARNMIAHEGSNFAVTQREIRRIISLYESVFKEFCLI